MKLQPPNGWNSFGRSEELLDTLWVRMSGPRWHYLSFTSDMSIWENRRDSSWLLIHCEGDTVTALQADGVEATHMAQQLAAEFGLICSS